MPETDPVARLDRRAFLRFVGAGTLAMAAEGAAIPVMAGPFADDDTRGQIPADKKLRPEWVASLFERGERAVYRGRELDLIGMPVGGIGAGQLYIGGDGRLWRWDIFNQRRGTGDAHYAHPPAPDYPVEQGFALHVAAEGRTETRRLDRTGFADVSFCGEYPLATVEYRDPACPLAVTLEAFSPFIPLNADDSSLPATLLQFTVRNTSDRTVDATLAGWLENAVCLDSRWQPGARRNRVLRERGLTVLHATAEPPAADAPAPRPDVLFEDWHAPTWEEWAVEGDAFGAGPVRRADIPAYQGDVGGDPADARVVNSHASATGADVAAKDARTGRLTSRPFTITRRFITFWIGGGSHRGKTCLNLLVDGKVARTATGRDANRMTLQSFDVRALEGQTARIEVVDDDTGPWGNIGVGRIAFSDRPARAGALHEMPDYGDMALALLGAPAEHAAAHVEPATLGAPSKEASAPLEERLVGALGRRLRLRPGQSRQVTFVVAWRFPNLEIDGLGKVGRHYAAHFDSARAAARYVADNLLRLASDTRLWHDTWYGGTLPRWFLDRTLLTTSVLATATCHRLADGRFYAWEGVGCCAGTCTHVWHYAHAMARLFPELERDTRERVDFGLAFHPDTGVIGFRAEFDPNLAVDGQAGTILRAYREHQMSPDAAFLRRCWPRIRQAFDPLLRLDPNADGLLEGAQMNTLDQPWYGRVAWLSSLYLAALRAGEAMAREMDDEAFAAHCRAVAERGAAALDAQLFNGEYFVQRRDPAHPDAVGSYDGCEIDQVFGDSWARQVGLPPLLPPEHVKTALGSLWKYGFAPDVGPFRAAHKPGRWYAMAGEGGLVMCSWPKGEGARVRTGFDFYFNECMTGFEYQAGGHMMWEGMTCEGLAIARAIHDRYHPARRNPWNEVECGDHYARSMASYGVYLAACGFEHHGPKRHIGFAPAPELARDEFRCAYTSAEGWGRYSQRTRDGAFTAEIAPMCGRLRVRTVSLHPPSGAAEAGLRLTVAGQTVAATSAAHGDRVLVTLADEATLNAGQKLVIRIGGREA